MTDKYPELEMLYTGLGKFIFDGLSNYAKYVHNILQNSVLKVLLITYCDISKL